MRLKRLSIKGFKSFADETDIHFNENLIGIVGPNGSGKSNVVDSIRWVLGEGKKSELRLADMKDVIFSGTKDRKEGRVARVTLTFDNTKNILSTEYSEVSITRILFRDGASEYRLNNVPCRKRDITDLFVDSGIGSNSYAIISLNMVEDILHDNGGSRRNMIEQAAGIAKYKVRKKETLRKLKATEEDLARVQDLLFEIEKSMQSFERQAKRTERFNNLKADYKQLAIKVSHIEVKEFSVKLKQLEKQLQEEQDSRQTFQTQINQEEAQLQQLKTDILGHEKSLNEDQQKFNQLIEHLGKVENEKNLALQSLTNSKERIVELEKSTQDVAETKSQSQLELKNAQELYDTTQLQLTQEEEQFKIVESRYLEVTEHYNQLRAREREIQDQLQSSQEQREALAREVEGLQTRWQIAQANISQILLRLKTIDETQLSLDQELEGAKAHWETAAEKVTSAEQSIQEEESKISNLTEELSQHMTALNTTQSEVSAIEQRIQFLKDIIENHEGLPESVKHILQLEKDVPIFSDLVTITDDRFTKIAELLLEPFFHYLVVPDEVKARGLYKLVRGAQKGKIHAFILNELPQASPQREYPGFTSLSSVVKMDAEYEKVLSFVCDGIYLSEVPYADFSHDALPNPNVTVLFPQDFAILSEGVLFGGSNTLFEGVQLGRKKILEGLETKLESLQEKEAEQKTQLTDVKTRISQEQQSLGTKRNELSNFRRAQEVSQRELLQVENKHRNQVETREQLIKEQSAKEEEQQELQLQLEDKKRAYQELHSLLSQEEQNTGISSEIELAFAAYNSGGIQKDEAQRKLFEIRSQAGIAQKDVEYHSTTISSIEGRLAQINTERELQSRNIEQFQLSLDKTKAELETLYGQKRELQEKLSSYEDTYYKEKGTIFELEKKVSQIRSTISKKDHLIATLTEKNSNLRYEVKAIHERNSIEFGIEIDPLAFPEEYENEDLGLLKEKRNKLNNRIRNYGDINPMAITAYNEIKERHDHITKERDDIVEAKTSLEETISEIEKTAAERFNASLEDIRINFRKVFQSLFSADDDCDIVLLNAEDPLEAKIEIVAKPKGKRPKSISQLSGGEKTLTAASFLFALYLLKPAPFCIFDEVDAPLDDVNVQKFNKIIREFSGQSQFIVITHNKLTMAEVDILYGVYLKEQGVSGLSAVDFRNYDAAEMLTEVEN